MNTLIHRSAPWLLTILTTALRAGGTAWAQSAPQGATPPMAHGSERPMHGAMMERMKARHEQHLAQLKTKLQLRPEQEPAWVAFAGAMAPPARTASRPDWAEVMRLNTPERIDRMKALHQERQSERNALMERRGEAAKAFYAGLSDAQKKVFDEETRQHMTRWGEAGRAGPHGHPGHHRGG